MSATDPISLAGRVALVTGAGSRTGIGFAAARVLVRRGAIVAVASTTDRIHERANELLSAGYTAGGFTADLTSGDETRALVEAVVGQFGQVDILVNNAGMVQTGVPDVSKRFHELSEEEWEHTIRLNLATTVNATRAVLPAMLERGSVHRRLSGAVAGGAGNGDHRAGNQGHVDDAAVTARLASGAAARMPTRSGRAARSAPECQGSRRRRTTRRRPGARVG